MDWLSGAIPGGGGLGTLYSLASQSPDLFGQLMAQQGVAPPPPMPTPKPDVGAAMTGESPLPWLDGLGQTPMDPNLPWLQEGGGQAPTAGAPQSAFERLSKGFSGVQAPAEPEVRTPDAQLVQPSAPRSGDLTGGGQGLAQLIGSVMPPLTLQRAYTHGRG